jgi:ribose transport system permease protein
MNQPLEIGSPLPNSIFRNMFRSTTFTLFVALVAYIIIITIIEPVFISPRNILNILQQVSMLGIVAVGATMVIISGEFDLSVGNLMAMAGCLMAYMMVRGGNPTLVAIFGIILCIGTQALVGLIITRFKVTSFIITIGMMQVYYGIAQIITQGSEIPFGHAGVKFEAMGRTTIMSIPTPVYFFIAVCIIFYLFFRYTRFGRRLFGLGENPEAAFLAGIDVKNYKVVVFGINGLLAGLAAVIVLSRIGVGTISIGNGYELDAIAAAVIGGTALSGGKGSIVGTFIGVIFIQVISNSLNIVGVSTFWKYVTTGGIIIIAVIISNLRKNT